AIFCCFCNIFVARLFRVAHFNSLSPDFLPFSLFSLSSSSFSLFTLFHHHLSLSLSLLAAENILWFFANHDILFKKDKLRRPLLQTAAFHILSHYRFLNSPDVPQTRG